MKKQIESVKKFHKTYKLGYSKTPIANLGNSKNKLRFNLMSEENDEYLEAANNDDLIEIVILNNKDWPNFTYLIKFQ